MSGTDRAGAGPVITIDYRNHRGVRALREVQPIEVWRGTSEFHDGEQWFLKAAALDRGEVRDFALADILNWATEPAPAASGLPQPGIYRHSKGNLYLLQSVGTHSEERTQVAWYRTLYGDYSLWARPLAMWSEPVEDAAGETVPRFAFVGPVSG